MSNQKATASELERLHRVLAQSLTGIIETGLPDPETGELKKAPASYYAVALKMLKDNNITGVVSEDSPLKSLLDSLKDSDILEELNAKPKAYN